MEHSRRLVAIMFTDIEGYTKLMQQSESAAVEIRKRHRSIFEPTTLKYDGEIIQYYGDGTLSIFNSTVQAVRCAGEMQKLFLEDPAITVRIGIHTGDILVSKEDIIGDSVNLAARVESLGVPGCVLMSGKVADEIANQGDLPLKRIGSFHFKNDRKEREVFALDWPELVIPSPKDMKGKLEEKQAPKKKIDWQSYSWIGSAIVGLIILARTLIPSLMDSTEDKVNSPAPVENIESLAVLPFRSLIPGEEDTYLTEGIHEEIINQLHRSGVKVKPRMTMVAYRNNEMGAQSIARELGVQALVEGNMIRDGDSLMIKINLIDGQTADYIQSHDFKVNFKDVLTLYKNVTREIAADIKLQLSQEAEEQLATEETVNPQAYDFYLQGRFHANKGTQEDLIKAISLFNQALGIDETYGPAYTGQIECHLLMGFGEISSFEAHTNFRLVADKALQYDRSLASNHHLKAMIKIFSDWDWKGAEKELELALAAEPTSSSIYDTFCQYYWATGNMSKSVFMGEQAILHGPDDHFAHCDLTWAYFINDDIEEAEQMLATTIEKFGKECVYHRTLMYQMPLVLADTKQKLLAHIKNLESTLEASEEKDWLLYSALAQAYAKLGDQEKAYAFIDKAYEINPNGFMDKAEEKTVFALLGEKDKFFSRMEEDFYRHSFTLMYTIKTNKVFDPMRDDPRFDQLLERMNLLD